MPSSPVSRRSGRARRAPAVFGNTVSSDQLYGPGDRLEDAVDEDSQESAGWGSAPIEEEVDDEGSGDASDDDEAPTPKKARKEKLPKEKKKKAPKETKSTPMGASAAGKTSKAASMGISTKSVARKPTQVNSPQLAQLTQPAKKVTLNKLAGGRAVAKAGLKEKTTVLVKKSASEKEEVADDAAIDKGDGMEVDTEDAESAVSAKAGTSDAEDDSPATPVTNRTLAAAVKIAPAGPKKAPLLKASGFKPPTKPSTAPNKGKVLLAKAKTTDDGAAASKTTSKMAPEVKKIDRKTDGGATPKRRRVDESDSEKTAVESDGGGRDVEMASSRTVSPTTGAVDIGQYGESFLLDIQAQVEAYHHND